MKNPQPQKKQTKETPDRNVEQGVIPETQEDDPEGEAAEGTTQPPASPLLQRR